MSILREEYEHPTQPSRVRLRAYEQPRGDYLVTEERQGASTVVATLGVFGSLEAARASLRERGARLEGQRYRRVEPAA